MYSKEQKENPLALYDKCNSVATVIQKLGYPKTRQTMYLWIKERRDGLREKAPRKRYNNSCEHPLHLALETKLAILRRCFIDGQNVKLVSEETGYSRASIYTWRQRYQSKGMTALMNTNDNPRGTLIEGTSSEDELDQLKQQVQDMQLEIDILKETLDVLKNEQLKQSVGGEYLN